MSSYSLPSRCLFVALILLFLKNGLTQTDVVNNSATDFFLAFTKNQWQDETLKFIVTTPSSDTVNFLATSLPTNSFSFVAGVSNGTTIQVDVPATFELQSDSDRQKGIRIHSTNSHGALSVVALKSGSLVSGGYLALPSYIYAGLEEYTYYGVTYLSDGQLEWETKSSILLVCSYNNTRVTITPSQRTAIPVDLRSAVNYRTFIYAYESYTFTMQSLQTFSFDSLQDLTGTKVVTNKPMTVLSSNDCVNIPTFVPYCDHIVEQVPPTVTWGRFFLVTSLHTRLVGERYKITALKSSTNVLVHCIVSGNIQPDTNTTSLVFTSIGQTKEFAIGPNRYCSIQASKPVMLMQFSTGYSLDQIGDPFMLYVPPMEQYSNNYTVHAMSSYQNHVSIVVPVNYFNSAKIYIRGTTIPHQNWSPIYCSHSNICGYGSRLGIATGANFIYHSDPKARIGVFAYGFAFHSAYGYPAGMELKRIADVCAHGDVRLIPTSPSLTSQPWGRVEVCQSGAWSSVCGSDWTTKEATVVCRQLGYTPTDASAFIDIPMPDVVSRPFTFTNTQCSGVESRLVSCPHYNSITECSSGKVAFVQCQSLPSPSVRTTIEGTIHLRSPVTIICSVQLSFALWNNAEVLVSWSKDSTVLQNSSRVSISEVAQVSGENYYQSNVTVDNIIEEDSGVYTCTSHVVLRSNNHSVTSYAIGATFLTIQSTTSQLIQLRLIGVGDCGVWLFQISNPTEKATQVINAITTNTENLCSSGSCGLTSNHITDSAFQCFTQNAHEVTFRASLHETPQAGTVELVNAMLEWIDAGATVSVNGVLMTVDPTCTIIIDSFSEPECQTTTVEPVSEIRTTHSGGTSLTTTKQVTTTTTTEDPQSNSNNESKPQTPTNDDSEELGGERINMEAIIGGAVAVIIVLILAVLIAIIAIACLCAKAKSSYRRRSVQFPTDVVSAVSPFPPPAYAVTVSGDQTPPSASAKDELSESDIPPDYMEKDDQYWNEYEHSMQPMSTTV